MQTALIVRTHAIRQYIERILQFSVRGSDIKLIQQYELQTGIREGQVVEFMLADVEPKVPATVLHNRTRRVIKGDTARFVVDRGAVVTCYTGHEPGHSPWRDRRNQTRVAYRT